MNPEEKRGKECLLFENLDKKYIRQIKESRRFFTLKKGDSLYMEGSLPSGVYCIHEGHIKAFKIGLDGKEQIIYLGKPGDLIGWQQLTCSDPYTTTAVALETLYVSHLPKDTFLQIMQCPKLALSLTKYICDDIILLESKVLELSQKSVKKRLATNLILLHQRFGIEDSNGTFIGVPMTREDYANLIGTNTETVIKLLSELRKEGTIDIVNKKIYIADLKTLKKIAD